MLKLLIFFISLIFLNLAVSAQETARIRNPLKYSQIIEIEKNAALSGKQWNAASIRRSIAGYLEAATNWENIREPEKAADCLREVSYFYIILGENRAALKTLGKIRQLDRQYSADDKYVKTSSLLAISSLRLGNIKEALLFSEKTLENSRKTNNPESAATAFYTQGLVNYENGQFAKATGDFENALSIWKSLNNQNEQAKTLLELAYAYMTNDLFTEGLEKAEESLQLAVLTENRQYQILAGNAVAVLKSKLGDKQEALNIFLESEKSFPDGVNALEKGDMFNHLSEIYENFGDLKSAQKYKIKALEIYQKENNPFAELATIPKLGILTFNAGDEEKGLKYFDTGFKLARQVKSEFYISVLNQDLGNLYLAKYPEKSLKYLKIALANFEKIKIKQHFVIIQNSIGSIYQNQGNLEIAEQFFNSSLKFSRETHNRFIESATLYNLAKLNLSKKKPKEALSKITDSIYLTENLYSDVLNSKLKSTYFSNIFERYELYVNLLMKMHKGSPNENFAIEALQAAEKSRARSMLENLSLSEADFTKDAAPEIVRREKEIRVLLNAKADKLTDLLSQKAEKDETDKISNEINELNNELEDIRAKLKEQSPVYSAIRNPAPFDVGEFQRNVLDDESLLLEFSFGREESYLWTISKSEVDSYVLPPRAEIEAKIEKLRELLKERELKQGESIEEFQTRINEAEKQYAAISKELSAMLFGQIADKLGRKRLIVVPDGELNYFPVSALPSPNSESDTPFLLSNEIVYEPSAQTLAVLTKNKKPAAAKNLLVFSDPIFTNDDARFAPGNKPAEVSNADTNANANTETAQTDKFRFVESLDKLPRLAASKDESEAITDIIGANEADVYSGFAATRENLLNVKAADYKILHFATHGVVDEKRPELSGIVLSRFDESGTKLDEFFRIQDIYALDLNADLVVLSACETGIGKEVKGEGLMSLNNAFLQTGAKSVVASLWKVEDGATLELMKNFYGAMANDNLPPPQALRRAQMKLRQNPQYQSPFYWAAFTVQGDFRNAPHISPERPKSLYLLLFAPLMCAAFYLFRKSLRHHRSANCNKQA